MRYKCLSIQQPWAELILAGRKRVENRRWLTRYRGPLAIHASRGLTAWLGLTDAQRDEYWPAWRQLGPPPLGCVVGLVEVVTVCRHEQLPAELADHPFAHNTPDNWCWVLARPRRLARPLSVVGQVSLFDVDIPEAVLPVADGSTRP